MIEVDAERLLSSEEALAVIETFGCAIVERIVVALLVFIAINLFFDFIEHRMMRKKIEAYIHDMEQKLQLRSDVE